MKKLKLIIATFPVLLALFFATHSLAAGPIGKRIVLENGMVLLLSEKHSLPMVTVNVAIQAGNRAEPEDKPGLASITASLLTQGTSKRSSAQISKEIDFIGGSLSSSGGEDFASVSLRVLSKDLSTGVALLADVLMHPSFDQKEIDRKVRTSLAEIQRQKEEPRIVASDAFEKRVFGNHPYGRTGDDVAVYLPRLTRQEILSFYSTRYKPNNTVIAVVGDVSEQQIVSLLNESFRAWKEQKEPLVAQPQTPAIDKTIVQKIDKKITQANIVMGHRGISRENIDYYAVSVMNYILGGGGFSSRLMDTIRDNKGLAYDVHSFFSAQKEAGAFTITIQTKNESANDVIKETLKEIEKIQSLPVSDKELADAKAYLTGSFPLRMDTSGKIAGILSAIELYNLGLDYPERYPSFINSVTKEDILRVAKKYLHPEKMVIVVVADQEKAKLMY